jgi:hypothetical protein
MPSANFPLDNGLSQIAAKVGPTLTSTKACLKDALAAVVYAADDDHEEQGSVRRDYASDIQAHHAGEPGDAVGDWRRGLEKLFPELTGKIKKSFDNVAGSADETLKYTVKQLDETIEVFAVRYQTAETASGNTRTITERMFAVLKGTSQCTARDGTKLGAQFKAFEVWLTGDFSYELTGATFSKYQIVGTPTGDLISLTCCASG